MTAVPSSFDSVTIRVMPSGFDSEYPIIHPDANISRDEYQQSIANINRVYLSEPSPGLFVMGCVWSVTIGGLMMLCCREPTNYVFSTLLLSCGIVLMCISPVCLCFQCSAQMTEYENRLQAAIAKESAKYSMRSPIGCTWRLETINITSPHGREPPRTTDVVSNFASSDRLITQSDLIKSFETPSKFDWIS